MGTVDWLLLSGAGLLGLIALTLIAWALFADRSRGRRRCPKCWFDMDGIGMRCPECGHEAKREKRFFRTRRRWRVAAVSIIPLLAGAAAALHVRARQEPNGWWGNVPTTALIYVVDEKSSAKAFDEFQARLIRFETRRVLPLWQQRLLAARCASEVIQNGNPHSRDTRVTWAPNAPRFVLTCQSLLYFLDEKAIEESVLRIARDPRPRYRQFGCELGLELTRLDHRWQPVVERAADDEVRDLWVSTTNALLSLPEPPMEKLRDTFGRWAEFSFFEAPVVWMSFDRVRPEYAGEVARLFEEVCAERHGEDFARSLIESFAGAGARRAPPGEQYKEQEDKFFGGIRMTVRRAEVLFLAHSDPSIREHAGRAIQEWFKHDGVYGSSFISLRFDHVTTDSIRGQLTYLPGSLITTERIVDSLVAALDDPDPEAKEAISLAAWEARDRLDEVIERLVPLEGHEDRRVRRVAVRVAERARGIRAKLDDLP